MKYILFFFISITAYCNNFILDSYKKSYGHEQIGQYSEAIKSITPMYKQYPNGYTLNLRMGWLNYLSGQYANAIFYHKKASSLLPNSVEPMIHLMVVYLSMKEYKEVEKIGGVVLKTDYYSYYGNLHLVTALIAQGKYDTAVITVKKLLTLYPTDVRYLEKLGQIYEIQHKKDTVSIYEGIMALDPNNIAANLYFQPKKK